MDLYKDWFKIGDGDFNFAKKIYENKWHKHYGNLCFCCHLAAEKYLKGYLVYKKKIKWDIFNLNELINLSIKYDKEFDKLKELCVYLNTFNDDFNYPDNHFDITEIEAKKALNYTKTIMDFVNNKINKEQER